MEKYLLQLINHDVQEMFFFKKNQSSFTGAYKQTPVVFSSTILQ